jgi:hypothetical protein
MDTAFCVTAIRELLDILLDSFTDPTCSDPVDRGGTNKITLQHDNFLSALAAH